MQENRKGKTVADSMMEQTRIVRPAHLNGAGRLFGGQLALWIDEVAGVVAQRHSGRYVVTAAIDNLRFRGAVYQNEVVVMIGKITHVGTTSMEIRVDSFVEDLKGNRRLINTAFVINVALDDNGKPCAVPPLILKTPFEEYAFQAGEKRRDLRNQLNKELYD